jgi:pyruvate dehydrogenase E1 component alpha subunit
VDGNDVLAVLAVTRAHLADAREGRGPSLIEAFTYRMGAHTTSDDPTRYRLASDLEAWRLKDPIERVRSFLWRQQLADQSFFDEVDAEAEALAVRLRDGCRSMPDPDPDRMFDEVYEEPHPLVEAERAEFGAYLASFEGSHA